MQPAAPHTLSQVVALRHEKAAVSPAMRLTGRWTDIAVRAVVVADGGHTRGGELPRRKVATSPVLSMSRMCRTPSSSWLDLRHPSEKIVVSDRGATVGDAELGILADVAAAIGYLGVPA
jgi:hypothetical protein